MKTIKILMTFVAFALVFAACDKQLTNEVDGSDLLGNKNHTHVSNGMVWNDSDRDNVVEKVVGVLSARTNASGPKIPSNAHSDHFPGLYFTWDWKQTHGLGYLKVQAWVFEEYEYFIITSKESNLYWDFKIVDPKDPDLLTQDNCYVFHIDRNWKNVNMVFLPEFKTTTPSRPCEEFEGMGREYCDCLEALLDAAPTGSEEWFTLVNLIDEAGCDDPGTPAGMCEYGRFINGELDCHICDFWGLVKVLCGENGFYGRVALGDAFFYGGQLWDWNTKMTQESLDRVQAAVDAVAMKYREILENPKYEGCICGKTDLMIESRDPQVGDYYELLALIQAVHAAYDQIEYK